MANMKVGEWWWGGGGGVEGRGGGGGGGFFFNDTATTEIYTLSLHDALPIWDGRCKDFEFYKQIAAFIMAYSFTDSISKPDNEGYCHMA